jgi:hypothetical protein
METIAQAQNRLESLSMDGKNGFFRGVLWAQRWIPVVEELPEENFTEYGIQFGFKLLIKCPNEMIYIGNRVFSDDHDKFVWRYLDGGIVYDVVSWRLIEIL